MVSPLSQGEADLTYGGGGAFGSLALYAASAALIHELMDDAATAGLAVSATHDLAELANAPVSADVAFIAAPQADGQALAQLAQFDMAAAARGTRVVVQTTITALDGVFGCLSGSAPQILIDPGRGERVIALARAAGERTGNRVRDLSEVDRVALMRLTEQVAAIARKLESIDEQAPASAFRFGSHWPASRAGDASESLIRNSRPPLPDPALIRKIIRHRQARGKFFDAALFADPAWDILLDLTAARAEHTRVSVSSLCIASGVPPTTALRWISQMVEAGLLRRLEDEEDRRRAFIALTDSAAEAIARYFAQVGHDGGRLV